MWIISILYTLFKVCSRYQCNVFVFRVHLYANTYWATSGWYQIKRCVVFVHTAAINYILNGESRLIWFWTYEIHMPIELTQTKEISNGVNSQLNGTHYYKSSFRWLRLLSPIWPVPERKIEIHAKHFKFPILLTNKCIVALIFIFLRNVQKECFRVCIPLIFLYFLCRQHRRRCHTPCQITHTHM